MHNPINLYNKDPEVGTVEFIYVPSNILIRPPALICRKWINQLILILAGLDREIVKALSC